MKGFKDSKGKFHPMNNTKGTRKSRDITLKTQGVKVRQKRFDKSKIQTLIFDKKKFNNSKALKWASDHEFKTNKIDTQKNTLRIRQFDPNKIKKGGECRTIQFGGSGVKGVLCEVPDRFKKDTGTSMKQFLDRGRYLEDEVKRRAEKGSPHFFDKDTMRFFSSRVSGLMWSEGELKDYQKSNIYFITSEADRGTIEHAGSVRAFTVRKIDVDGDINAVGEFQGHSTLSEARMAIKDLIGDKVA